MEKKNMVLLTVIAVATLLVAVVGATFAFFTATVTDSRDGDADKGQADITAGRIAETTTVANIEGVAGHFTVGDVYPGHKEAAALTVTVSTTNTETAKGKYAIVYNVTENTLSPDVTVSIYKSETEIEEFEGTTTLACTKGTKAGSAAGEVQYSETCAGQEATIFAEAEQVVTSQAINSQAGEQILYTTDDISVTNLSSDTAHYYIVFEFKDNNNQNSLMGKKLDGDISVKNVATTIS